MSRGKTDTETTGTETNLVKVYDSVEELWNETETAFNDPGSRWNSVNRELVTRWRFFWHVGFFRYHQRDVINDGETFLQAYKRLLFNGNEGNMWYTLNILLPQKNHNITSAINRGESQSNQNQS